MSLSVKSVSAQYARTLNDFISISGVRSGATITASDIRARVFGYTPQELVGIIVQGDQRAILLKSDLDDQGFPEPIKGDKIITDAATVTVQFCDPRKVGTDIVAYDLRVRG